MDKRKKFGAFAGVFTPSILTILGVIMYMRLGWVVGQAGLIGTLLIVLLAHVVSVSTGLSISSIATDKQVKEGGIYYMLSRSLGLPMGGAIGLALFVATALGISLYIVGFSENFLGIEIIRHFLNLDTGLNSIRIVGTGVVIVLTILGLISTSLVIRTQYIILGAIALSLISIFVGFLWEPASNPETVLMFPASDSLPMATVFAVFFPAVTGFTAGVAMSGDLKNAKKDIPRGTLGSIITGLIVYVSLVLVMAFFMPRATLLNDNNFLMHSAWIGGLVVAGIWGATLSSALGGILGGPRIMQAIALDKILPKFLSRGQGKNNEPRAAIIVTFLIAEAGILIGDLNAIAELVSMFYLTSYGFINLAYVLESWASSDFRPSMRIPHWVGILGFVITFGIMFQMNPLAMIISLVLMIGIYFILKRRELQLDLGDVWQSVWSAMARSSLHHMDRKGLEERNWRPNIILFSGGSQNRPYLIEFGKAMVGKHGLLSNFDLIEKQNDNEKALTKHDQADKESTVDTEIKGIFSRKQTTTNVYDTIANIAENYGFAGVEPNTVLMGWARHTKDPDKFVQLLNDLQNLDMNILMIDYDKRKGFGNYKTIDIWWRGGASNSHLAIQLVKFLWLSEEWKESSIRLMIINPINDQKEIIRKETTEILNNLRIKAEIKIINNEIEHKPLYDIIRVESINSDLIFLGLPSFQEGQAKNYIENINSLCQNIGTVVLVGASSKIKPLELKADIHSIDKPKADSKIADVVKLKESDKPLQLPENKTLADQQTELKNSLLASFHYFKSAALDEISAYNDSTLDKIKKAIHDTAKKIQQINQDTNSYERAKTLLKIKQNMLNTIGNLLIQYRDQQLGQQKELIESELSGLIETTQNLIDHQDSHITIFISAEALKAKPKDPLKVRSAKFKKRLLYKITGKQPSVKIPYKELIKQSFPLTTQKALNIILEKWGIISGQFIVELQNTIEKLDNNFKGFIEADAQNHTSEEELKTRLLKDALDKIKSLKASQHKSIENLIPFAQEIIFDSLNNISKKLDDYYSLKGATTDHSNNKDLRRRLRWLAGIPAKWKRNQELFFNSAILDTYLLTFSTRIHTIFNDISYETEIKLKNNTEKKQQIILDQVNDLLMHTPEANLQMEENLDFDSDNSYHNFFRTVLDSASKRIRLGSRLFPVSITLMTEETFNEFHDRQYSRINTARLSVSRLMDYLIQNELIAPLQDLSKNVPAKIIQNNKIIREEVRLLDFTLTEKQDEHNDEQISDFIYKRSQKIKDIHEQTKILENETLLKLRERVSSFSNNLQFSVFSHKAFHSRQYITTSEKTARGIKVKKQLYKTWQYLMMDVSKFYYRRSSSILKAKLIKQKEQQGPSEVEDILNIIDASQGNNNVVNSLPFYYRQLFLRKQNYLMDFSIGRENELQKAKKALIRYQSGYKGGILLLGERYSGKTFLAQYIINNLMYKSNLILVHPPYSGSVNRNDFKQALISATDKQGEYDDIFSDLPVNSIILFEDIDLWWERTTDGMQIIGLIMKIIQRYANRYMFMVTANKQAFQLINKIQKIEHQFLSIIECEPMGANDLGKAIMLRHESGNLKFKLGKQAENQIRPWVKARLFSRYFAYTKGNIGITLQAWIHNITHFSNGVIYIKPPHKPDLGKLEHLETDWYIAIVQIILHRRVTVDKFSRIMRINREQAAWQLEELFRAGILTEQGKKIFEIHPVIYPHIMDKLTEMKLL